MTDLLPLEALAWTHLVATLFMVGLIWFVQVVHYPLFSRVPDEGFTHYQAGHLARTSPVVLPPMLVEAASAVLLVLMPEKGALAPLVWGGIALLAVVWASTFLLQVPAHSLLERRFDAKAHRRLVVTNWIRTAAWSARGAIAARILHLVLQGPTS